jgi:U2-associated protein SR140
LPFKCNLHRYNAVAATDVAEILTEALTLAETPVPIKVARLFLVSDILHNCGAPVKNASAYRGGLVQVESS